MSRPRVFIRHELPSEVVGVAIAVIADYERRAREIKRGVLSEHLISAYKKYNDIVDEALSAALIEVSTRDEFVKDIAAGRGYEHSMIGPLYNRKAYYLRKRELIYRVARGLGLWE